MEPNSVWSIDKMQNCMVFAWVRCMTGFIQTIILQLVGWFFRSSLTLISPRMLKIPRHLCHQRVKLSIWSGNDAFSTHTSLCCSENWKRVNDVWHPVSMRCCSSVHVREKAANIQPKVNASCKAVQMFAYSDRWSSAAEKWCSGLRPAPNFHTWWDLNKGRDFITLLTPNNTGYHPHNPLKPPLPH